MNPFEVAAWVRGRVSGGTPSAVSSARQVLRLVQASTDCLMHLSHPTIRGHLQHNGSYGVVPDEAEMAKEIDIGVFIKINLLCLIADRPSCAVSLGSLLSLRVHL